MKTPYGAWRASYVHGRWTVLSGPTSMVVLEPAPSSAAGFIARLWAQLLDCASIGEIVTTLTTHGLDQMPNLGVFFWDDDRLHCLLRGSLTVFDAATDAELASGAGARTWYETTLSARSVQLPLDDTAGSGDLLELPLVVGAVQAASVYLDAQPVAAAPPAAAAEPAAASHPAAAPEPAVVPERAAVPPTVVAPAPAVAPQPVVAPAPAVVQAPAVAPAPAAADEPAFAPVENSVNLYDSVFGERLIVPPVFPDSEPEADVAAAGSEGVHRPRTDQPDTDELRPDQPHADQHQAEERATYAAEETIDAAPQYSEPVFRAPEYSEPVVRAPEYSEPIVPPPPPAFATVIEPEIAAEPAVSSAPEPELPPMPEIPAAVGREPTQVLGQRPPYAPGQEPDAEPGQFMGAAGQPLGSSGTTGPWGAAGFAGLQPPPPAAHLPAAILLTAAGERVALTGPMLIGRAPASDSGEQLLRVPSPNHDISRTHLRIAPKNGRFEVTDMNSTNGTIVVFPDGRSVHLVQGQSIDLVIGGAIDLGDAQTISLLAPQ